MRTALEPTAQGLLAIKINELFDVFESLSALASKRPMSAAFAAYDFIWANLKAIWGFSQIL
ncbi:MAG: hypothetical protein KGI42_06455 [Xanthomonadaceae bacterium]|nr:hypothetical protein [Xanthomonadaceae bacterium]